MSSPSDDEVGQSVGSSRRTRAVVEVLGEVRVHTPDGPQPIAGRVDRCLLALLVLHRRQSVDTTHLIERVWGDDPPDHAPAQLRRSMRNLARATAAAGLPIVGDGTWFSLDAAPGSTDLDEFRGAVAAGRRLIEHGRSARAAAELARAVGLWARTSPFLGAGSDGWPEAAELREELVNAIEDHAVAHIAAGRPQDAVELLDLVARHQPLRESVAVLRIRAHAHAGDEARALDVHAEIRRSLADALGLDPGPELAREVASLGAVRPSPPIGDVPPGSGEHLRVRPA